MGSESVVSQQAVSFWRQLACQALHVLRGVIKMNAEQSAAWELVTHLVCGD
jgi:hypothetical protein